MEKANCQKEKEARTRGQNDTVLHVSNTQGKKLTCHRYMYLG